MAKDTSSCLFYSRNKKIIVYNNKLINRFKSFIFKVIEKSDKDSLIYTTKIVSYN